MSPQPDPGSHPEVKELTETSRSLVAKARTLVVKTPEQYAAAGVDLQLVKGARDRLDKIRKSMTSPLDQAKKAIMEFFRGPTDELDETERLYKRGMIAYTEEQERLRREEQARADEAARKEQERLQQQAAKAAAAGKAEKAAVLEQRAASAVAPVVQRQPPKVAGIQTRKVWKFEITDEMQVPRQYLVVDESKIRKVVQALQGQTQIPGVRVYSEDSIAAGAA